MLRRLLALLLIVWALGFVAFAAFQPQPAPFAKVDGIIVLTGGEGRIAHGLDLLRDGAAPRLLVSGVDPEVKPGEFAAQYKVGAGLLACCVTLGYESVDTRSNARESAQWIAHNHLRRVRLVTSDWHMRRAAWELRQAIPANVELTEDAVPTRPSLGILFAEYSKFVLRRLWHIGKG
jgi:uncharacterized SAM-binding protein YcdF (DUF218 family)